MEQFVDEDVLDRVVNRHQVRHAAHREILLTSRLRVIPRESLAEIAVTLGLEQGPERRTGEWTGELSLARCRGNHGEENDEIGPHC